MVFTWFRALEGSTNQLVQFLRPLGGSWGLLGASRGPPGVLLWLRGGSSGAFLGFPVGLVERLGAFSGSLGVHVTLVPRIAGSIEFYRSKSVQDTLAWPRNSLENVAKPLNL